MKTCYEIVDKLSNRNILGFISLTYENRFLRRKKLISDEGIEFLVNLSETKSLNNNQAFKFENEDIIVIKLKKENLLQIKSDNLINLVWHIGNRHIPCQIEKNRILIQNDDVIKEMILKLEGKITNVFEPFNPSGGAYGIGRTHSHKH